MKTISTLLLASVFSTSAFAWGEGKIGITLSGTKDLQVTVDGRTYQSNDNFILLNDVQPGNHTIAVYRNNAVTGTISPGAAMRATGVTT